MSPLRSLGNVISIFNDFYARTGKDAVSPKPDPPFQATGGNQTTSTGDAPGNGYKYHVFTSSGELNVTGLSKDIEFLVVAGGGGGGYSNGGGAGAGGLRTNDPSVPSGMKITSTVTLTPGPYTITVGDGGGSHPEPNVDRIGSNSSIGSLVVASGGGGGGPMSEADQPNMDGGSGGGSQPHSGSSLNSPDPLSPSKQGNNGGTEDGGGAGGGAGGSGSGATGGSKLSCPAYSSPIIHPICPMPLAWQSYVGSNGDYAGGGYGYPNRSSSHNGGSPYAGIVNTGGGADSNEGGSSITGGKGIVIIRYTE